MGLKASRHLRSEYTKDKRRYPRSLTFLVDLPFVAVLEVTSGSKVQRTIEVKPAVLEELHQARTAGSTAQQALDASRKLVSDLSGEIQALRNELADKQREIEQMQRNIDTINKNFERRDEVRPNERSAPSYLNQFDQRGVRPGLPGLSGGLPSLVKRSK